MKHTILKVAQVAVLALAVSFAFWLAIFDAIQNIPGAQQW